MYRSIEQQARMIKEKQNRDAGRRLMDAIGDQDEVIWHYRRIKSMFRQLQVSRFHVNESAYSDLLLDRRESEHMGHCERTFGGKLIT
jgi:hypothetical protein